MGRKSNGYAPEFRQRMIELVAAGRTPEELAREFEPSAQAIRNWVAQAQRDAGKRGDGLTSCEREELVRLRARWRFVRSRPGFAFSFTAQSTPASSAARRFASLA